jgi:ketosteroid isomerase-like protein
MGAAENKKMVADAFAEWARGDGSAVFKLLADDVHWTVIGNTPASRAYKSKREFVEGAVKPLSEKLAGALKPTVRDIVAEGDKVMVEFIADGAGKNGKPYHQTYCWAMRVKDGKVSEGTAYLDTELISEIWK